MWKKYIFISDLMYENGKLSPGKFYPGLAFLFYLAVSSCMAVRGQHWDHYETFSTVAGAGALAYLLGNKFINSKYNSEVGKMPDKE